MKTWKTPDNYKTEFPMDMMFSCDYETKQKIGCIEKFQSWGFLKNLRWDYNAEYQTLCKDCPHFRHDIGIYFGNGNYTDNISNMDIVFCLGDIHSQDELLKLTSVVSKDVKAITFGNISIDNLYALSAFHNLECVSVSYCPKLEHFWNFEETPNFKVLEFTANTRLTDISEISNAKSLEYLGIETLTSRTNLNYIKSFYPLTKLSNLKEVSLNATMCIDNDIDNLINIPNLCELWISPHTFQTEDFAKFEALKFKIYDEYGIFQNGDYACPLGKGVRGFRSEKSKDDFKKKYMRLMAKYSDNYFGIE